MENERKMFCLRPQLACPWSPRFHWRVGTAFALAQALGAIRSGFDLEIRSGRIKGSQLVQDLPRLKTHREQLLKISYLTIEPFLSVKS